MLKQFYIFCFLIGMTHLTQAQHLQLIENRGEIGLFGGQASYRGDIAPDKFLFNKSYGAFYKKLFNDYGGFRLNYEQIQLGADDLSSNNEYATSRGFNFLRQFHDISLMGEFYFTRFIPGNKAYRFSPYLGIGVGYLVEIGNGERELLISTPATLEDLYIIPTVSKSERFLNFPLQIGFKYNLSKRWNIFSEVMYRFVNKDELDYIADGQLIQNIFVNTDELEYFADSQIMKNYSKSAFAEKFNFQGSRSGNDQFFSAKFGISYNLIKIYGEEKWKPGKRSLMNRLKREEAGLDKPGFFSRLKFKRK
jgi:opacity protein-like surface antigen